MPLAKVDHLLVDARKSALGHHCFDILQSAVGAPHLATVADHHGHGRIHDDIVGRVEIGNSLGRVHHGQFGAIRMAGVQVAEHFFPLRLRQCG